MADVRLLARAARRFNAPPGLPRLFFFTDPERTPDPMAIAETLPTGTAVVYRHFGAWDRVRHAHRLAALCRRRRLSFLVGADPDLAAATNAVGVHLPERQNTCIAQIKRAHPRWLITVAAHSARALAAAEGADAAVLSPIETSGSPSAAAPLGIGRAGRLARAAPVPVIGLGGLRTGDAAALARAGFAGMAGIELFVT